MNFKKKLRDLFTLTKRSKGGFTLVELIVVIAILAILAGVAIPVYSGYVKKAEKAGDEQLLAAVNKAFTAAVSAAGDDITTITAATLTIKNDGTVDVNSLTPVDYTEDFKLFYQGNESSVFKGITALGFDATKHVFIGAAQDGGKYTQIFNGIANIAQYKTDIQGSVGFTSIGAQGLTSKLDTVTGLAGDLAAVNSNFRTSLASTLPAMQDALGFTGKDAEFEAFFQEMVIEKAAQLQAGGIDEETAMRQAGDEILSNYAVLNAAYNTAGKTTEQVISDLKTGFNVQDIKNMMSPTSDAATNQQGMSNAAMMYAMYTAYANGPECDDKDAANAIAGDISTFANTMANTDSDAYKNFQAYLETDTAKADAKAYLAAMNVINESAAGNPDAVTGLLMNGYNTSELTAALQQLMGG